MARQLAGAATTATPPRVAAGGLTPGRLLDRILAQRAIRSMYQPIVELTTGRVAAYEALARGPEGTALEMPGPLFDTAARVAMLTELEWECRRAAIAGALEADLGQQTSIFINVEPRVAGGVIPRDVDELLRRAGRRLRLVLELTERDLTRRPADLLALVRWARQRWWGVALDDVGVVPESLALLPFVNPDVVKLDMSLVHEPLTGGGEMTLEAVHAHCRRTGAVVLAEGIETPEHETRAVELGATLGQGWLYGRPAPLDRSDAPKTTVPFLRIDRDVADLTPFQAVVAASDVTIQTMRQAECAHLAADLAERAGDEIAPVVLGSYGHHGLFTSTDAQRWTDLAPRCLFAAVAAVGLNQGMVADVRCTPLDPYEPMAREWAVVVVTPHHAEAVVAKGVARPDAGFDADVEVITTKDRTLVLAAAQALMARVVPA